MCRIRINLIKATPAGTQIDSIVGQYRLVGASNWITFPITLTHPQTEDITIIGNYELRVNVTNNIGDTSAWSDIVTFSVSFGCVTDDLGGTGGNTTTNFDGAFYYFMLSPCNQSLPIFRVKSSFQITNNDVYFVSGSGGVGLEGKVAFQSTDFSPVGWVLNGSSQQDC